MGFDSRTFNFLPLTKIDTHDEKVLGPKPSLATPLCCRHIRQEVISLVKQAVHRNLGLLIQSCLTFNEFY